MEGAVLSKGLDTGEHYWTSLIRLVVYQECSQWCSSGQKCDKWCSNTVVNSVTYSVKVVYSVVAREQTIV